MSIPQGTKAIQGNAFIKSKTKKRVNKFTKVDFKHGNPDFVDERVKKPKKKADKKGKTFFRYLFGI